jgi:hypothetical protein
MQEHAASDQLLDHEVKQNNTLQQTTAYHRGAY